MKISKKQIRSLAHRIVLSVDCRYWMKPSMEEGLEQNNSKEIYVDGRWFTLSYTLSQYNDKTFDVTDMVLYTMQGEDYTTLVRVFFSAYDLIVAMEREYNKLNDWYKEMKNARLSELRREGKGTREIRKILQDECISSK